MNVTTTITLYTPGWERFVSDRFTAMRLGRGLSPRDDWKSIRKARREKRRKARELAKMKREALAHAAIRARHARSRGLIGAAKKEHGGTYYGDFTGYGKEARESGWALWI
jgi:hypothetical protein